MSLQYAEIRVTRPSTLKSVREKYFPTNKVITILIINLNLKLCVFSINSSVTILLLLLVLLEQEQEQEQYHAVDDIEYEEMRFHHFRYYPVVVVDK